MTARSVLVTLDRERHLRFTVNSLADLEQHLGTGLGGLVLSGRVGIQMLRGFVWAGLKHEDAKLTVVHAGDLLQRYLDQGGDLEQLAGQINEAMALAGFGGPAAKEQAEPAVGDGPRPFPVSTSG